jgi:nijmegen breakage syndrome protein 1
MRVKLYKLKDLHVHCPQCDNKFEREVQKGVDVGIATLIVRLAAQNQYNRLILSAGDGDFEDAIAFAKEEMHKEFWLSGFDDTVSADLQSYANKMLWLGDVWEEIQK